MAKRVIRVAEYDLMYDGAADDLLYSDKHAQRVLRQFHFTDVGEKRMLDVVVHGYRGEKSVRSATEIYIPGSHKHVHFFKLVSQFLQYITSHRTDFFKSTGTWMAGLTLRDVNDILQDLNQERPHRLWIREIKSLLTPEELAALPKKFVGACLPVNDPNISFIHPSVVRGSTATCSETVRWKFLFRCRSLKQGSEIVDDVDMLSVFPNPRIARCYEEAQNEGTPSPWPYLISPKHAKNQQLQDMVHRALDTIGFVTLPLSAEFVDQHIRAIEKYMYKLMKCPEEKSLFMEETDSKTHYYRSEKGFTSKHIPDSTGRTLYGHYSSEMKNLCVHIEPLLFNVMTSLYPKDDQIWVTTSEIIIQRAFNNYLNHKTSVIKKTS